MATDDNKPTTPATMRAWLYSKVHNGIENSLTFNEAAPRPPWPPKGKNAKNHVLVRVHYASLNPVDYKIADMGFLARAIVSFPASPGLDFSGVVAATVPSATPTPSAAAAGARGQEEEETYQVGDRVFGRLSPTRFGALGEYVVAEREGLAKVPPGVSLEHASCIGTAALTALQCIAPNVAEGGGDRVFINGGSGGTGTFGIQIAKALGCWVAASTSTANADLCARLGADEVIDYRTRDVSAALRELAGVGTTDKTDDDSSSSSSKKKFKLVVDNVGTSPKDLYKAANDYLLPAGRYVQVGGGTSLADVRSTLSRSLLPAALGGGRRGYAYLMVRSRHADLARVAAWVAEGRVGAVVDEVFPCERAPEAFRKLKTGRARGKLVVRVAAAAAAAADGTSE